MIWAATSRPESVGNNVLPSIELARLLQFMIWLMLAALGGGQTSLVGNIQTEV